MHDTEGSSKRIRKSRGTGLRTRTGCLTCRRRHRKCDERRPICGPCSTSNRHCSFAHVPSGVEVTSPVHGVQKPPAALVQEAPNSAPEGGSKEQAGVCLPSPGTETLSLRPNPPSSSSPSTPSILEHGTKRQSPRSDHPSVALGGAHNIQVEYIYSPTTVSSELLSADLASTRWLDLLATDAAQADNGFCLRPTGRPSPVLGREPRYASHAIRIDSLPQSSHISPGSTVAGHSPGAGLARGFRVDTAADVTSERQAWQLDEDICLHSNEAVLFRIFAERAALWLDLFDPLQHFSTHATRLALRNLGLMKAILALTSRHAIATASTDEADPSLPVQYYYETLHYVQSCLKYTSYTRSEELLATTIIISTYEMLDNSNSNWTRHLKGVFWIQRSQDVNGASGGLRQSVWWAWLRQDLWAAFREKRACLSFWRPLKDVADLTQNELADRAVYLLSQSVNYCADTDTNSATVTERVQAGDGLLSALARWRTFLGPGYRPLPSPDLPNSAIKPVWIHPPRFAVALQMYNFALILVTLHRPGFTAGFQGYLRTQQILSDAVDMICGIAMELKDEGSQILSAQCLFGAGLCTHDTARQEIIISLINNCASRSGWPMSTLTDDLKVEWVKINQSPPIASA